MKLRQVSEEKVADYTIAELKAADLRVSLRLRYGNRFRVRRTAAGKGAHWVRVYKIIK